MEWRSRHRHPCQGCGKLVDPRSKCCYQCNAKLREQVMTETSKVARRVKQTGERGHNWRGGRRILGGYVLIYCPEHPRADKRHYVPEHWLVWEKAHGKPLPKGWIIHHLNGIKNDNRLCNLQALPNKKHYLVLQSKAKRIQELEALLNNQHQLL